mgnify:CR=1 FL=1
MRFCYAITSNYGLAIILFTLATKIILFPVSFWVHTNGIKMVRIQPAINRLKVKYFGDQDKIADEQADLFKKEKYSPFASIVPILLQLVLLIGLIQVIYHPLSYVLNLPATTVQEILQFAHHLGGIDTDSSTAEILALNLIQHTKNVALPNVSAEIIDRLLEMDMNFLCFNLSGVPMTVGGTLLLIPLFAGFAAVVLSLSQNKINPLQKEQTQSSQFFSMAFSVGISLIVGFLIPAGVGFYWTWSNLFSIVQQIVLNLIYKPEDHINYAELAASKKELAKYENIGTLSNDELRQYAHREKEDYKRFFSIINKHLVFYSESNGFFKYFERTIQYLLKNTNLTIHYITSDPNDQIFTLAQQEPQIKPYYIGAKKLITLLMKLEADVVVMTMSDLENYHYKRSYMRKDIEYVYMFHYPLSTHMVLHTGALDHYDTILCVGDFQFDEIRKQEELYNLPKKKLIACGYGQLETLYDSYISMENVTRDRPKVLIAPSWQEENILDSCIDELLNSLLGQGFDVVVRPHPEYVKRYRARIDEIVQRYSSYMGDDLTFELDFTSNKSIFDSDVVISDWSGTAYEFSFVTERPCVFIDTPPKIHNPEYVKLGIEPLEITLRDKIGLRVAPDKLGNLASLIRSLLTDTSRKDAIRSIREKYVSNFGESGKVAANYLIERIQYCIDQRR